MKTSVIEVHDMLSVLSVDEVEKRIGEVRGVESVTVNYAAGNATVRYDETRLQIGDVKSAVRRHGFESDASAVASAGASHEEHTAESSPPATPEAAAPNGAPDAAAAAAGSTSQDPAAPSTAPSTPTAGAPQPSPVAPDSAAAGDEQQDKIATDKS